MQTGNKTPNDKELIITIKKIMQLTECMVWKLSLTVITNSKILSSSIE